MVAACLDNVERHVGPDARAWVLLEGWPDRVEISVRDEGPGHPRGPAGDRRGRRPARGQPVDPRPGRRPRRYGAAHHRRGRHRVGDQRCRDDHPHDPPLRRPRAGPGAAVPRPARRRRDAVDGRRRCRPGRAHAHLGDGRAGRAGPGARPGRPRLRPGARRRGDRRAVVQLLSWADRDLAEGFAGTAPAPGGVFRQAEFVDTDWGPRLGARDHLGRRTARGGRRRRLVAAAHLHRRARRGRRRTPTRSATAAGGGSGSA